MASAETLDQETRTSEAPLEATVLAKPALRAKKIMARGKGKIIAAANSGLAATKRAVDTKADIVLKKLRLTKGASITKLMEATGWQAHSVRGFLSGTVKKKLGLTLISDVGKDGIRRYRIDEPAKPTA